MPVTTGHLSSVKKKHIPALDGIRALAAITVFAYHYGGGARSSILPVRIAGDVIHFGWSGVSLFFVLSGFLISGILWDSFANSAGWWKTFYIRRSLRIFPLYYFALLLSLIAGMIALHNRSADTSTDVDWSFVFYLQDIPNIGRHFAQLPTFLKLGHFWSLAVEEQFYLVWPFMLWLTFPSKFRAMRLCGTMWAISFLFRFVAVKLGAAVEWSGEFLLGRTGELCAGSFLAIAIREPATRLIVLNHSGKLLATCSGGMLALILWSGDTQWQNPLALTVGFALSSLLFSSLVASCLRGGHATRIFENKVLGWTGKISYGIYVYHILFYVLWNWIAEQLVPRASATTHLLVLGAVALAGTLTTASLSFYLLELPFLRLKDNLTKDSLASKASGVKALADLEGVKQNV